MYRIKIFSQGKTKEPYLNEALSEYSKRLSPLLSIEWILLKEEEHLFSLLEKEPRFICLDAKGVLLTSEDFAEKLMNLFMQERSSLSFAIGGAQGFPPSIKKKAFLTLSLSPMTFPHQMARLLLLEQIYRSFEIQKNSKYHK